LITRQADGHFDIQELMAVQFVEFVGQYGWND